LLFLIIAFGYISDTHPFPTRRSSDLFRLREAGIYLFSQAVSSQLSSAQVSLTSVFGMGTGGASPSSTPAVRTLHFALSALCFCPDRKSTRLNSSHVSISYAVFFLKN